MTDKKEGILPPPHGIHFLSSAHDAETQPTRGPSITSAPIYLHPSPTIIGRSSNRSPVAVMCFDSNELTTAFRSPLGTSPSATALFFLLLMRVSSGRIVYFFIASSLCDLKKKSAFFFCERQRRGGA